MARPAPARPDRRLATLEVGRPGSGSALQDPGATLRVLLRAWQETPDTRLGEAIERVSALLPLRQIPRALLTQRLLVTTLVARRSPEDVGTLVAVPWPNTGVAAWRRLREFATLPPDPRVNAAIYRLFRAFPYAERVPQILSTALQILERSRAPRALEVWREVGPGLSAFVPRWGVSDTMRRRFEGTMLQAAIRVEGLGPEDTRTLSGLFPATTGLRRSVAELIAEVYADPGSDEPREVLADALIEAGDPRGEFIRLQLTHARGGGSWQSRARERALQAEHGMGWALMRGIEARTVEFERGFPACALVSMRTGAAGVFRDPFFRTFRALGWAWPPPEDLTDLHLLVEAHFRIDHPRRVPPALRTLGLQRLGRPGIEPSPNLETLCLGSLRAAQEALPRCRRLRLYRRETRVHWEGVLKGLPAFVEEVEVVAAHPQRDWTKVGWGLVFERDVGFRHARLSWHGSGSADLHTDPRPCVAQVPSFVTRLSIEPDAGHVLASIEKALPGVVVDLRGGARIAPA